MRRREKIHVAAPVGCNAVAYAPVPGDRDIFIARQFYDADGWPSKGCRNDNVWGLVIARLDWRRRQFLFVSPALPVPATITAGQMKRAMIRSAYDPDMVLYQGKHLTSFECSIENYAVFGVQGVSVCIGEYDPSTRKIDWSRTNVVISTQIENMNAGPVAHTASVPYLLVFDNRLYLYWSAVTVLRGRFSRVAIPTDPQSDSSVDIRSLWTRDGIIVVLAAVGGGGCTSSLGLQPGHRPLPTNPSGYSHLLRNPNWRCW